MKVKLPVTLESGASYTAVVYARFQDKLKQPMPFVATISADPGSGAVVERIGDLVGKSLSGSWDKKRHELSADEKNFKAPQFLVCSPHEEEVTFELKADAQSFMQMVLFQVPNQFPIHSSTGPGVKEVSVQQMPESVLAQSPAGLLFESHQQLYYSRFQAARSQYYDSSAVSFSHVLQKGTLYILVCRQAKLECGFELSAKSGTKLSAFQQL